jgi:glycosyltransferase involved in cell wall biosynthesis
MIKVYKDFIPAVSVITASFNRAELLKRCISSLLNQTFTSWELILVDDGGNDATFEMMNEYLSAYENIRYIKHKNRKLALTRNAGILSSVGAYITFLDSDDEYKKEHLQLRYDYMQAHPKVDLVYGEVEIIGSPYVKDKNDMSKEIHLKDCVIGGSFFGKREVFTQLGGFKNIPYSEDSELFERAQKKFNIEKVNFPTYIYYRDSPDGICNNL